MASDAGALPDPQRAPRPWLDRYPPGVPTGYDYPIVPATRLLDDAAADFPETVGVDAHGYQLTYREVRDRADRFATALSDLHVGRGDHVSLLLPPCPQHVIALFAVLRLGAVVVEHDPGASSDALERQVNEAGSRAVVCLDPLYGRLAGLKGRLPSVRHIIATGLQDALPFPRNVLFPVLSRRKGTYRRIDEREGVLRFTELIHRSMPFTARIPVQPETQPALVTHAEEGRSLAFSHTALVTAAFQTRLWIPDVQAGTERILAGLPLHTAIGVGAQLLFAVLSAATLVMLRERDARRLLRAVERTRPTLFLGASSTFGTAREGARRQRRRRRDLTSLRVCLAVGERLEPSAVERFERDSGARLRLGWGVASAGGLTHANAVYGQADAEMIGLPLPDVACVLVDPQDPERLAPGKRGLLAVAGPQIAQSHAGPGAKPVDGWVRTGELAESSPSGFRLVGLRPGPST